MIRFICSFFLVLFVLPVQAQNDKFLPYEQLHMGEIYLLENPDPKGKYWEILAQRMIDPDHWNNAKRGVFSQYEGVVARQVREEDPNRKPWQAYGEHFWEKWQLATAQSLEISLGLLPSLKAYKRLHSLVYFGKWGPMLLPFYDPLKSNHTEKDLKSRKSILQTIKRALKEQKREKELSAFLSIVDLDRKRFSIIRGGIQEGYDLYMTNPFDVNRARSKPFTDRQREIYNANPYLEFGTLKSVSPLVPGTEVVFHPQGPAVMKTLKKVIKTAAEETKALKAKKWDPYSNEHIEEAALIAARLHHGLVSIHAVWDGSGRSAKMLRNMVLRHLRLPPPRNLPRNDIDMGVEEIQKHFVKGIEWSLKKLSRVVKKNVPKEILENAKNYLKKLEVHSRSFDLDRIPENPFDLEPSKSKGFSGHSLCGQFLQSK